MVDLVNSFFSRHLHSSGRRTEREKKTWGHKDAHRYTQRGLGTATSNHITTRTPAGLGGMFSFDFPLTGMYVRLGRAAAPTMHSRAAFLLSHPKGGCTRYGFV